MNLGEYPKYAIITLCGFLLFFLGFSLIFEKDTMLRILTLFAGVAVTIALSYGNRSPIGGLFLGAFASVSFVLGLFVTICTWELSEAISANRDWTIGFLGRILSVYGTGFLSASLALCSIGLFCGLLGYVFGHISLDEPSAQPRIFRDYWSSVLQLGKSDKREFSSVDRKLSSWSLGKQGWRKRLFERLTEPQSDLYFAASSKNNPGEISRGDLFDISSGRMVGENLTDPSDLASKFRPNILKVAATSASTNPKGVWKLATERLIERLLKRLLPSRAVWAFYLLLSIVLTVSVYYVWTNNLAAYAYYEGADLQVVISAILSSAIVMFFVWRWRKTSKIIFQKRPDERILVFIVYVILALLFGFCYDVIVYPPGDFSDWAGSWFVWTRWFLLLSLMLGVGYIFIHRESEATNTYFYDNRPSQTNANGVYPYKKSQDEPFWLKSGAAEAKDVKAYWVLRFMYFWRYELAKVPHPDWERVEIWIDAEKGTPEWVVTDYHFRELWYKVIGDIQVLYVRFFVNFHTPIPVVDSVEADAITGAFNLKKEEIFRMFFSGKYSDILNSSPLTIAEQNWSKLHPAEWIQQFGLPKIAANFCSNLNWTYWRYPLGTEDAKEYSNRPAATPKEQPVATPAS